VSNNTGLASINLSDCNLSSYSLLGLAPIINSGDSISLVHLTGNPGSSDSLVLKYYERLFNGRDAQFLNPEVADQILQTSRSTTQKRRFNPIS